MPEQRKVFTVSQLTQDIKLILEASFAEVWVEGEVSNFSKSAAGHIYFDLKDAGAQLKCAFFYNANKSLKFEIKDGLSAVLFGRISVYGPKGQYQLYAQRAEPKGLGALGLAFEQLKEKLSKEGLFDQKHKKPIPALPLNVGVVTSKEGAALRDILTVLKRRSPFVSVLIRPVKVQGELAKEEIARAINEFNEYRAAGGLVDVLIVGRGGGSVEDLWAFNEEIVARAIYESKIPVISAVGHEVDYTISDFVADVRAPTPSAAAEIVIKKKEDIEAEISDDLRFIRRYVCDKIDDYRQSLDGERENLSQGIKHTLEIYRHNFINSANRIRLLNPANVVAAHLKQIENARRLSTLKMRHLLDTQGERISTYTHRLNSLNPLSVLSRGFSLSTMFSGGQIIKNTQQLKIGDKVRTKLDKGAFISTVETIISNDKIPA